MRRSVLVCVCIFAICLIALGMYLMYHHKPRCERLISFEEAVAIALGPKEPGSIKRWFHFKEYRVVGEYTGEVYSKNGIKGYFLWHAAQDIYMQPTLKVAIYFSIIPLSI